MAGTAWFGAIVEAVHDSVDAVQSHVSVLQHAAARTRMRQVQEGLQAAGFSPGPLDGRLSPHTRTALRQYQQRKGLRATGTLDKQTLEALRIR